MNLDKALKILRLTGDFTEDELKKEYKKLMSKYHSFKLETKSEKEKKEAEEKAKEINDAKDYLENYIKININSNTSNQRTNTYRCNTNIELIRQRLKVKKIINDMKEELYSIPNSFTNNTLNNTKEAIMYIIKETENQIDLLSMISNLQRLENTFYHKIYQVLTQFETDYCKKYNITTRDKILNKYSLKRLNEELEELKEEQNAFSVEEVLEKELNKYVYYNGYLVIKKLIENITKDIISENSDIRDSREKIINKFNKRVLKEFEAYYKRLKALEEFKSQNLTNPKSKKLLKLLESNIANPETFKYYEKQLTNAISDTLIEEKVTEQLIYNNNENINKIKKKII